VDPPYKIYFFSKTIFFKKKRKTIKKCKKTKTKRWHGEAAVRFSMRGKFGDNEQLTERENVWHAFH